jgi:phytoene dehydrogenase-like protein
MLRSACVALLCLAAVAAASLRDDDNRAFDAIVIGSGSSAMGAVYKLVEEKNKKILVLEKAANAGGCQHSFEFNGTMFQTGFDIDTCPRDQWSLEQLSGPDVVYSWPAGYPRERVYVGSRVYDIPNGANEYIGWLYDHMDVASADTLIRQMEGMGHNGRVEFALPGWDFLPPAEKRDIAARQNVANAMIMEIGPTTLLPAYLDSLTSDTDVQAVLAGVVLLCLGLPASVMPAFPIVQAMAQLSGGFSFPVQTPDVAVELGAEVTKILVDPLENAVTGVQLRNGTVFFADRVLATIGIDALLAVMDGYTIPDWPLGQSPLLLSSSRAADSSPS